MKEYTTNISFRITINKLIKIDTEAEKQNINRNELLNKIIDEYLRGKIRNLVIRAEKEYT